MNALLVLGVGALVLGSAKSAPARAVKRGGVDEPFVGPKGRDRVIEAWARLGTPDIWQAWGVWVAKGESGWNANARNASVKERAAANKAWERLSSESRISTPRKPGEGSGGWYGQLYPFTSYFGAKVGAPVDLINNPERMWQDAEWSTAAHIGQVHGTYRGLVSKLGHAPTALQLRAAYGNPSRDPLAVDTPERRAGYSKTLERAGLSPSLLDERMPPLVIEVG